MSNLVPTEYRRVSCEKMGRTGTNDYTHLPSALPFLLQLDPEAIIEVELVEHPVDLPQSQFEALLVDSECEV